MRCRSTQQKPSSEPTKLYQAGLRIFAVSACSAGRAPLTALGVSLTLHRHCYCPHRHHSGAPQRPAAAAVLEGRGRCLEGQVARATAGNTRVDSRTSPKLLLCQAVAWPLTSAHQCSKESAAPNAQHACTLSYQQLTACRAATTSSTGMSRKRCATTGCGGYCAAPRRQQQPARAAAASARSPPCLAAPQRA